MYTAPITHKANIRNPFTLCGLLLLLLLSSCDKDSNPPTPFVEGEQIFVSFTLKQTTQHSRFAISPDSEEGVFSLFAMVFDENGSYLYGNFASQFAPGSFRVPLFTSTLQRTIYFIANTPINESIFNIGMSTATVASLIEYTTTNDGISIPMWGKHVFPEIVPTGASASVELLRSMARIDVLLNVDNPINPTITTPIAGFTLIGIQAYRQITNGRTVPAAVNLAPGETSVTAPTLPTTPIVGTIDNPYPATLAGYIEGSFGIPGKIYVNENTANTGLTATSVIVESIFQGVHCFYRLNVGTFNASREFTYGPILRNHRYIMNITGVIAVGYPTVEEALNNDPSNIEYSILSWENSYQNVVFDWINHFFIQSKSVRVGRDSLSTNRLGAQSDIDTSLWEMSFADAHNGASTPTFGSTIQNNRFMVTKSDSSFLFTALKAYSDINLAGGETHRDTLIVRAKRLEIRIAIEQIDQMRSDWDDGGTEFIDL